MIEQKLMIDDINVFFFNVKFLIGKPLIQGNPDVYHKNKYHMNIKLNFLAKFIIIGFYAYSLKSFSFLESSNISPKVIIPPLESWCLPNYLPFQNNLPGQGVINGCFRGFYRKHNIFPNITDHEGRGLKLGWEKYMHLFDSPHFLQKKV